MDIEGEGGPLRRARSPGHSYREPVRIRPGIDGDWTGTDKECAIRIVAEALKRFSGFCAVSFERRFHSPADRAELDELLKLIVLPKATAQVDS